MKLVFSKASMRRNTARVTLALFLLVSGCLWGGSQPQKKKGKEIPSRLSPFPFLSKVRIIVLPPHFTSEVKSRDIQGLEYLVAPLHSRLKNYLRETGRFLVVKKNEKTQYAQPPQMILKTKVTVLKTVTVESGEIEKGAPKKMNTNQIVFIELSFRAEDPGTGIVFYEGLVRGRAFTDQKEYSVSFEYRDDDPGYFIIDGTFDKTPVGEAFQISFEKLTYRLGKAVAGFGKKKEEKTSGR